MTDEGSSEARRAEAREGERIVPMRLQKFLARAGVASRRGSEDLMTAGRVQVNGVVVAELGAKVDPATDEVTVDGATVHLADEPVYIALHKPRGFVTTMSDPQGRPTVANLVPTSRYPGLFPVGRLDFDTTGLLLFTTDGEIAHRLLHPKHKIAKTYRARVDGVPDAVDIKVLSDGVDLDDGRTAPARVRAVESDQGRAVMEMTITEGRKRQVKRMFSAVGHPVLELHRTRFGPLALGPLPEGQWRLLSPEEIAALRRASGTEVG